MVKTKKKRVRIDASIKAIAGKQLTEEQIKIYVDKFNKDGNFPGHKIPCTVTGKLTTAVGPWLRKKVKEFGSVENLLRGYKCRGALKAEKPQKVKAIGVKKRRNGKTKVDVKDIPAMPTGTKRPQTAEEFREASHRECARPDIFLDNGRHCLDCPHFANCENDIKCLPKGYKFINGEFVEVRK